MLARSRIPLGHPWSLGVKDKTRRADVFSRNRIAIFKTDDGKYHGVEDMCSHRGARLSTGKVKDGCLQCPYHGWLFDKDGKLVSVPTGATPQKADITKYNIEEHNDFLWWADENANIPDCEEFNDPEWSKITGTIDLHGNWLDWVANATDISHINYVHDFADETNGSVDDFEIHDKGDSMVCTAYVRPKAAHPLTRHMQIPKSPIVSEFFFPNTTVIKIKLKNPYEFITYTTLTPINFFETRMTWCFAHNINLGDPMLMKMLNNHFRFQMEKTIREDESIIFELPTEFVPRVNVQCDMYQVKVLEKINKMVEDNGQNLFITM